VQIGETFGDKNVPLFVEQLDALALAEKLDLELAPVMVYADDVTHIVTEEGVANLLLCRDKNEREQAIRGLAGYTDIGPHRDAKMVQRLRERGVIRSTGRPRDRPATRTGACWPTARSRASSPGRADAMRRRAEHPVNRVSLLPENGKEGRDRHRIDVLHGKVWDGESTLNRGAEEVIPSVVAGARSDLYRTHLRWRR